MAMHHTHGDQLAGSFIGAALVTIDSLSKAINISWGEIIHTIILATAGGVVGFLVTTFLKWIKKKLTSPRPSPKGEGEGVNDL